MGGRLRLRTNRTWRTAHNNLKNWNLTAHIRVYTQGTTRTMKTQSALTFSKSNREEKDCPKEEKNICVLISKLDVFCWHIQSWKEACNRTGIYKNTSLKIAVANHNNIKSFTTGPRMQKKKVPLSVMLREMFYCLMARVPVSLTFPTTASHCHKCRKSEIFYLQGDLPWQETMTYDSHNRFKPYELKWVLSDEEKLNTPF